MTTEEMLKDLNARSAIEWAYRAGMIQQAYVSSVFVEGLVRVPPDMVPFQKYKAQIISASTMAEDIVKLIDRIREGDDV